MVFPFRFVLTCFDEVGICVNALTIRIAHGKILRNNGVIVRIYTECVGVERYK